MDPNSADPGEILVIAWQPAYILSVRADVHAQPKFGRAMVTPGALLVSLQCTVAHAERPEALLLSRVTSDCPPALALRRSEMRALRMTRGFCMSQSSALDRDRVLSWWYWVEHPGRISSNGRLYAEDGISCES